jgi:hypothetical protein
MKSIILFLFCVFTVLYSQALGYETYTPSELKAMIARGEYPKQSSAGQKKSSVTMGFEKCKLSTDTVLHQLGGYYPKEVIISTSIIHTSKMWANDGTVSITCSKLDNKMIIVESKYEGREIYKKDANSSNPKLESPITGNLYLDVNKFRELERGSLPADPQTINSFNDVQNTKVANELRPMIYPNKSVKGVFSLKLNERCIEYICNSYSDDRHGIIRDNVLSKKITTYHDIISYIYVYFTKSNRKIKAFIFDIKDQKSALKFKKSMEKSYGVKFPEFEEIRYYGFRENFYSSYFNSSLDSFFDQSVVTVEANKYLEKLISKVKDYRKSSKATEVRFKNASITIQENRAGGYSFFYETHEHEKIMKEGFAQIQRKANKKKSDSELFDPSIFE